MQKYIYIYNLEDFHAGPTVKTLPSNAGDRGSIPCQGTRFHMPYILNYNNN